ncbi:MAG: hypothetical protein ACRDU5_11685 [Mycobacterium sp.]
MKLMAVLALACGFTAAPMMAAGTASGLPPNFCDGAECVPHVDRDVAAGASCHFQSRFPFGLTASGDTLVCNSMNEWVPSAPLIGVRTDRAPCAAGEQGMAQGPDGLPLSCDGLAWSMDFNSLYYS